MTKEEQAIEHIKIYRKLDEDLYNTTPKGTVSSIYTKKCLEFWDITIKALERKPKTGHWITWYEQKETEWYIENIPHCKCSECGKEYDLHLIKFIKYCNECGAKMQENEDKITKEEVKAYNIGVSEQDIAKAFQFGVAFGFGKRYDEMDRVIDEIKNIITSQPKKPSFWQKCERCGKPFPYMVEFCRECTDELLTEPPKPFEPQEESEG